MHPLAESIVRFVYPARCAGCDAGELASAMFCGECDGKMRSIERADRCGRCSMPAGGPGLPCPHCRGRGLPPFGVVASLGTLGDPLRRVIHRAKFSGEWPRLEQLADRLFDHSQVKDILRETDLLVPVPLHRRRQVERGYNQADVMSRRLGQLAKMPVYNGADRTRATEVQSQLASRQKRVANLRDAFRLREPRQFTGHRIVLVDDVLTTGSTLVYLARKIQEANPASLAAIVLAVADPKGREFEFI
jgi:competence protein ComFC